MRRHHNTLHHYVSLTSILHSMYRTLPCCGTVLEHSRCGCSRTIPPPFSQHPQTFAPTAMGNKKNKGRRKDPEAKAALQARKESKADQAALKRQQKEEEKARQRGGTAAAAVEVDENGSNEQADAATELNVIDGGGKAVIETLNEPPPPRANATFTWFEEAAASALHPSSSSTSYATANTHPPQHRHAEVFYLFGGEYFDGAHTSVVNHLLRLTVVVDIDVVAAEPSETAPSNSTNPSNDPSSTPATNTSTTTLVQWERIHCPLEPPPRCAHSTVYYNHALYVFGGEAATDNGERYHHYRDCWRFDLRNLEWTELTPPRNKRLAPSPRSGHVAVVWQHYMIVFGGFFDAASSTIPSSKAAPAKWFNDVYVLDLTTHQWQDRPDLRPQSTGPQRRSRWGSTAVSSTIGGDGSTSLNGIPDRRSACNGGVVGDTLIVHGGFSKLGKRARASEHPEPPVVVVSNGGGVPPAAAAETKVHTDAWRLDLPALVGTDDVEGLVRWERLLWSTSRTTLAAADQKRERHSSSGSNASFPCNPNGRCGTASDSYANRFLVVLGGVMDAEHWHHRVDSVFFNDMFVLDPNKKKWHSLRIGESRPSNVNGQRDDKTDAEVMQGTGTATTPAPIGQAQPVPSQDLDDDVVKASDALGAGNEDEEDNPANMPPSHGWSLDELRSNMFAFLDGDGNLVYEKMDKSSEHRRLLEDDDEDEGESDEEKEECKDDNSAVKAPIHQQTAPSSRSSASNTTAAACAAHPLPMNTVSSSSVMVVNPDTKVPAPVVRSEPLPRINANLVVGHGTLYLYGGLVEVGDREVTLDDLWRLDLRQRESRRWECLFPGTMHRQVWRGADHDDDDSYVSSADRSDRAGEPRDDEDDEDDEHDGEDNDDDDQRNSTGEPSEDDEGADDKDDSMPAKPMEGVDVLVPTRGESLADYYARTTQHWTTLASSSFSADGVVVAVDKELKREAFRLARERFAQLEAGLKHTRVD